jgi:hypothetical protein
MATTGEGQGADGGDAPARPLSASIRCMDLRVAAGHLVDAGGYDHVRHALRGLHELDVHGPARGGGGEPHVSASGTERRMNTALHTDITPNPTPRHPTSRTQAAGHADTVRTHICTRGDSPG